MLQRSTVLALCLLAAAAPAAWLTAVETGDAAPAGVYYGSVGDWELYRTAEPAAAAVGIDDAPGGLFYVGSYRGEPDAAVLPGVQGALPDGGLVCRWSEDELLAACGDPNLYYIRLQPQRRLERLDVDQRPRAADEEVVAYLVEQVSLDAIQGFDADLAGFRTRYVGTDGNHAAQDYLAQTLSDYGYTVTYDNYLSGSLAKVHADGDLLLFCGGGYDVSPFCFYSSDGGGSFSLLLSADESSITGWGGVCCFAPATFHYGAYNHYYRSTDGGASWEEQTIFEDPQEAFLALHFADEQHGYAFSNAGGVYRTSDGGTSWDRRTGLVNSAQDAVTLPGDPDTVLFCAGTGRVLRSTDGGADWTIVYPTTDYFFYQLLFTDAQHGLAVGDNVIRTSDGGLSWEELGCPAETYLRALYHRGGDEFIALAEDGAAYQTDDYGSTWQLLDSAPVAEIRDGDAAGDRLWFIASQQPGYTDDDGDSFTLLEDWLPRDVGRGIYITNILADKIGGVEPLNWIYATAHFDSISSDSDVQVLAPGANDNGSGSTALLEAARVLAEVPTDKSLRFAFFDAEEVGLVGSGYHAQWAAAEGLAIEGLLNLDMVVWSSDPAEQEDLDIFHNGDSLWLAEAFAEACADYGDGLTTKVLESEHGGSDHYRFWRYGYDALLGIEDIPLEYPYYHSRNDDYPNLLDHFPLTRQVTRGLVAALGRLAGVGPTDDFEDRPTGPYAYPNPCRAEHEGLTFARLEPGSELSIYDTAGALVYRVTIPLEEFTWRLINDSGYSVASGVYLWVIVPPQGEPTTGKAALIR